MNMTRRIELTCVNCIWNDDLLCDKIGVLILDDDKACRKWELVKGGDDTDVQRKSD